MAGPPARPLDGVRVLDLTSVVMGPYATQALADLGADVVKVEPPEGDLIRKPGPMRSPGMGAIHHQINRNKRSLVLDLKKESARAALLRLCRTADVFVTNVRPAAMARLRLAWDDVRSVNERMVYASLVGFGQDGPYARQPAYDDLIQGLAALPSLFARAGGDRPRYAPSTLADHVAGLGAAHAIVAALLWRERDGHGHHVEVPMFESLAQFVLSDHMGGRTFDPPLGGTGYGRLLAPSRRPFETRDGYICVLLYTDRQWEAFFRGVGREAEWAADPRLHDFSTRTRHYDDVYRAVAAILETRTTDEWLRFLRERDIPCAPLHDADSLVADAHLGAVGFFETIDDPVEGRVTLAGVPTRWDGARLAIRRLAPVLGEHGLAVLEEAGFTSREIDDLLADGATVDGRRGGRS